MRSGHFVSLGLNAWLDAMRIHRIHIISMSNKHLHIFIKLLTNQRMANTICQFQATAQASNGRWRSMHMCLQRGYSAAFNVLWQTH